jgi:hypothetical protein
MFLLPQSDLKFKVFFRLSIPRREARKMNGESFVLFEDIFDVKDINKEGKVFDKGDWTDYMNR